MAFLFLLPFLPFFLPSSPSSSASPAPLLSRKEERMSMIDCQCGAMEGQNRDCRRLPREARRR